MALTKILKRSNASHVRMVVNYAKLQQRTAQNAQQNCQRFIISILIQTHVYKIHVRPNMQRLKTIHV